MSRRIAWWTERDNGRVYMHMFEYKSRLAEVYRDLDTDGLWALECWDDSYANPTNKRGIILSFTTLRSAKRAGELWVLGRTPR